jgi:hypothetical protein
VDPPVEGWCQTVPNEGNPRLISRPDPLIRSSLHAGHVEAVYGPAVKGHVIRRKPYSLNFEERVATICSQVVIVASAASP